MTDSNSANARRWYPFDTKQFWLLVLTYLPISTAWFFIHFPSYVAFHGTVAAAGPILIGLLGFWRQRDWRFLAIAATYPILVFLIYLAVR